MKITGRIKMKQRQKKNYTFSYTLDTALEFQCETFENFTLNVSCAIYSMQGVAYIFIYLFSVCNLRKCKLFAWNSWWCAPRVYLNNSIRIRLKIYASISIRCGTCTGITTCCCYCCRCQEFILFAFLFFRVRRKKNDESQWWCSRACMHLT